MPEKTTHDESQDPTDQPQRAPVRRWHHIADEWLTGSLGRFLEYGCGPCFLMKRVATRCDECHGVDVDEKKIAITQEKYPEYILSAIGFDGKTPYEENFFDTAAIIEVIEHVPDERVTLTELTRIIKPGGTLILTTPHRGLLTFLDTGNFKFVFPRLHRFVHVRLRGDRTYYEERFSQANERGMIGDITATEDRKPWHRHYKPEEIISHCSPELVCEQCKVFFPGMRALMLLQVILNVCTFGRVKHLFWPLSSLEHRLSRIESRFGDQLVMLFRKSH